MASHPVGTMLEFPRGDRFVIESYDAARDEIQCRWIRGGCAGPNFDGPQVGERFELDDKLLALAKPIESPP